MSKDSQGPRKTFSKSGSSDFNKRKSHSNSDKSKRTNTSARRPYGKKEDAENRPYIKREDGKYESADARKPFGERERKSFTKRDDGEKRPYVKREDGKYESAGPRKPFGDRERKPFAKREDGKYESTGPRKPFGDRERKPFTKREDGEKRPYVKREDEKYESAGPRKPFGERERKPFTKREDGEKRPYIKREDGKYESSGPRKPFGDRERKPFEKRDDGEKKSSISSRRTKGKYRDFDKPYEPKLTKDQKLVEKSKRIGPAKTSTQKNVSPDAIRLNKYVANAGVCSRREADVLIATGVVSVNGKIITEMGYKVNPTDVVNYGGVPIKNEVKKYLLLNKPKDYITTMDDPEERKTVVELIRKACKERLYPVGRLDRNTTGVLLFTNDGDLTAKLTHPKFNVRKVYHVVLDKRITSEDFKTISEGFELADGFIKPDAIEYVGEGKSELGIEIHSGRNRIVRRMFEYLGYEVIKLDRVAFAGLTKKDLPRSKYRFLTPKEVDFLKMLG